MYKSGHRLRDNPSNIEVHKIVKHIFHIFPEMNVFVKALHFKGQIEHFLGEKNIEALDRFENVPCFQVRNFFKNSSLSRRLSDLGYNIMRLIQRDDVYLLLISFLLTNGLEGTESGSLNRLIYQVLQQKISILPEFEEWLSPQDAINDIINCLIEFSTTIRTLTAQS